MAADGIFFDPANKTLLYILHIESLTVSSSQYDDVHAVLRWYVDAAHHCSEPVVLQSSLEVNCDYCCFFVASFEDMSERDRAVTLTTTAFDDEHLCAAFLNLRDFSNDNTFHSRRIELQNEAGIVAMADIRIASQQRWAYSEIDAAYDETVFVDPDDDPQAKYVHTSLFPGNQASLLGWVADAGSRSSHAAMSTNEDASRFDVAALQQTQGGDKSAEPSAQKLSEGGQQTLQEGLAGCTEIPGMMRKTPARNLSDAAAFYILYIDRFKVINATYLGKHVVCRWYVGTSSFCSDVFELACESNRQQIFSSFLVLPVASQCSKDIQLIATLSEPEGGHLCAAFLDLAQLSTENRFCMKSVELQNQDGIVAAADLYSAVQQRWNDEVEHQDDAFFVRPDSDSQASYVFQNMFTHSCDTIHEASCAEDSATKEVHDHIQIISSELAGCDDGGSYSQKLSTNGCLSECNGTAVETNPRNKTGSAATPRARSELDQHKESRCEKCQSSQVNGCVTPVKLQGRPRRTTTSVSYSPSPSEPENSDLSSTPREPLWKRLKRLKAIARSSKNRRKKHVGTSTEGSSMLASESSSPLSGSAYSPEWPVSESQKSSGHSHESAPRELMHDENSSCCRSWRNAPISDATAGAYGSLVALAMMQAAPLAVEQFALQLFMLQREIFTTSAHGHSEWKDAVAGLVSAMPEVLQVSHAISEANYACFLAAGAKSDLIKAPTGGMVGNQQMHRRSPGTRAPLDPSGDGPQVPILQAGQFRAPGMQLQEPRCARPSPVQASHLRAIRRAPMADLVSEQTGFQLPPPEPAGICSPSGAASCATSTLSMTCSSSSLPSPLQDEVCIDVPTGISESTTEKFGASCSDMPVQLGLQSQHLVYADALKGKARTLTTSAGSDMCPGSSPERQLLAELVGTASNTHQSELCGSSCRMLEEQPPGVPVERNYAWARLDE